MIITNGVETTELKAQGSIDAFLTMGWKEVEEVKETKPKPEKPAAPKKTTKSK